MLPWQCHESLYEAIKLIAILQLDFAEGEPAEIRHQNL
jgi:hypothetical protein